MKMYQLRRLSDHPVITAADVKPSHPQFQVMGAFNPAACRFGDEILLLLRVAEAVDTLPGKIQVPIVQQLDGQFQLVIKTFPEPEGDYDPRVVQIGDQVYLTSLSHLRLARSRDGIHFTVDPNPFIFPERADESFGVEDARITFLDNQYWITYTAVSENGPGVGLIVTKDFVTFERKGMILAPPNKDACLFPQKINGFYYLLHRPMVSDIGKPSVWLARSPDGIHWGDHRFLFGATGTPWEHLKIGVGPEPLLTDEGWLVCYHGASVDHAYSLALALLDRDDPTQLLDRSTEPLLVPELEWEKTGFFPNVVFTNGWVRMPDGRILVYYGAADYCVGVAELVQT
ncbi:glycoside hydrolase family 130 protein [Larkinella rosea]|uniref:Glycosidase n=1 Tax=Larkinella rosea TaxID=2025312 RepID=A0A3P1BJY5_9BACT|nr:glycoside hydrolase family 130 protein [Larkinella rosea]RRB00764.1 glycosidase [Larkinella rosea]